LRVLFAEGEHGRASGRGEPSDERCVREGRRAAAAATAAGAAQPPKPQQAQAAAGRRAALSASRTGWILSGSRSTCKQATSCWGGGFLGRARLGSKHTPAAHAHTDDARRCCLRRLCQNRAEQAGKVGCLLWEDEADDGDKDNCLGVRQGREGGEVHHELEWC
jgi:hypothetical protein